jgi:hypothetical protein
MFTVTLLARQAPAQDVSQVTQIAPGLTITAYTRQLANGPLRFWIVRAEKRARWNLGLEIAEPSDAIKKRSVRTIATRTNAPVAVNGGFFSYGGGAVGAVKDDGEWQRLPWKARTAIGWSHRGFARIDSLSGQMVVHLGNRKLSGVNLNGLSRAYSFATDNGFAVITPRFGKEIGLRPTMGALVIRNGKVDSVITPQLMPVSPAPAPLPGDTQPPLEAVPPPQPPIKTPIPADGWLLVALTPERNSDLAVRPGTRAVYKIATVDIRWDRWPYILGAGPRLVKNGEIFTTEKAEEFRPDVLARGPRTAVGFDQQGNWLFLVADGRQVTSVGLTLPETAALFREFGAWQAMNLDGGSSTQLVVNGQLINTPSAIDLVDPTKQREVQVTNALVFRQRN